MATHSSILAWKILWTEEPGGLQFTGLQRIRHDWASEHTTWKLPRVLLNLELIVLFVPWLRSLFTIHYFCFASLYVCPRAFSNFVSSALKGVLIVVYSGTSCIKTGEGCHLGRSGSETSIFLLDLSEFTIHSNIHLFTTYLLSTYWVLGSMLEVSFLFELCWGAACGIFVPRRGI